MAHVLHTLLVCDDIVVQGEQSWYLRHHKVSITRCLHHWVVQKGKVIETLDGGKAL
jgi:hypothetical protein